MNHRVLSRQTHSHKFVFLKMWLYQVRTRNVQFQSTITRSVVKRSRLFEADIVYTAMSISRSLWDEFQYGYNAAELLHSTSFARFVISDSWVACLWCRLVGQKRQFRRKWWRELTIFSTERRSSKHHSSHEFFWYDSDISLFRLVRVKTLRLSFVLVRCLSIARCLCVIV